MSLDTDILIIGAGMSGIGLAVQLIRNYGLRDFEIVEKTEDIGGTWWMNTYPGCGCDVASHLYSYSFALNPDWTQKFSKQTEIQAYFRKVAECYGLFTHVSFSSMVRSSRWDSRTGTWMVEILEVKTQEVRMRRCKVLLSAVGALSVPKECEIPGASNFKGSLFHSAEWDHNFDYTKKGVVVIGNGCSATQFVPVMSDGENKAKKITQFSRQAHWLSERPNPAYSALFKWTMRWVPGAMRAYRAKIYYDMEWDFAGFYIKSGEKIRQGLTRTAIDYIKKESPKRYHEALIPKTVIGCKRKVMDTSYLSSLHRENVELIHSDPIQRIQERGVITESGSQVLFPMEIYGENGVSLNKHWASTSDGAAQAYYGTCVSGFPNFFIMMGPNTTTGHLSVIYSVECQINFTMRLIEPILHSLHPRSSLLSFIKRSQTSPDVVAVKSDAEKADNIWIMEKTQELVWSSGCSSWYLDPKTNRNVMIYPSWQFHFWLRSIFIPQKDFIYRSSNAREKPDGTNRKKSIALVSWAATAATAVLIGVALLAMKAAEANGWENQ
ncbi:MAG: hypothetical protein M1819_003110 [Sarea resinae]|nr:MAG: hypothetical protein M1819_003110 [Sarea resinae]